LALSIEVIGLEKPITQLPITETKKKKCRYEYMYGRELSLIIKQWIKTRRSCFFEKLYLLDVSIFADIIFNSEKMTNLNRQNKLCIFKKNLTNYLWINTRNTRTKN